jgi:hypothetical protein
MNTTTSDDDDEQVNLLLVVDYQETILLAAVHCHAQYENKQRRWLLLCSPSLFDQRLWWDIFCALRSSRRIQTAHANDLCVIQ